MVKGLKYKKWHIWGENTHRQVPLLYFLSYDPSFLSGYISLRKPWVSPSAFSSHCSNIISQLLSIPFIHCGTYVIYTIALFPQSERIDFDALSALQTKF